MSRNVSKTLEFLKLAGILKKTPRKGWEIRNIPNPECVAGHMYRMALMTFLLGENDSLDKNSYWRYPLGVVLSCSHDGVKCIEFNFPGFSNKSRENVGGNCFFSDVWLSRDIYSLWLLKVPGNKSKPRSSICWKSFYTGSIREAALKSRMKGLETREPVRPTLVHSPLASLPQCTSRSTGMQSFCRDLPEPEIKCMKMALIHDLPECIVGDITPYCGVSPTEKKRLETEAMDKLAKLIGGAGTEMLELFKEYESQSTPEAKFVKQLDQMDMVLQAFEYEMEANGSTDLQEFFNSVEEKFSHPLMVSLKKELDKQREEYHNNMSSNKQ